MTTAWRTQTSAFLRRCDDCGRQIPRRQRHQVRSLTRAGRFSGFEFRCWTCVREKGNP